jgi:hypothetical protein
VVKTLVVCCLAAGLPAVDLSPGLADKQAGRLAEAERFFRSVHASDPAAAEAVVQLATVIGWQGRLPESERLWRDAVALRPGDADVLTGLARVRWWMGDHVRASEAVSAALLADPRHADAINLHQRLESSGQNLIWRADAGVVVEHYSAVFGNAVTPGVGLSATWRGLGTLSAGVKRRSFADAHETTWLVGLGLPLPSAWALEVSAERTWDPVLASLAGVSGDVSRACGVWEPVLGWRRSWYQGDHVDLARPGVRLLPLTGVWAESQIEARALVARSPVNDRQVGWSLRAHLAHEFGWSLSIGGAIADEAEPPRAVTRVITTSAGAAWNRARWGIRLDLEHEDRLADWLRDSIAVGVRATW